MIESDQKGRAWLYCDFCKNHQRRVLPLENLENEFYICDSCQDKVEYLMDNFAHIERLIEGELYDE